MSEQKRKYYDALDNILDRPIAFNPSFKRITGSTNAALLLSQAFYWTKRTKDPQGWFYKTRQEWGEETGLTENELDNAREKCRVCGVMEEKLRGVPATVHYRVNKAKVYELLGVQIPAFPESSLPPISQIPTIPESDKPEHFNRNTESTTGNTAAEAPTPDFANMSINEAYRVPTLQMYRDATGVFPGAPTWEYIHNTITAGGLTKERIAAAFEAWNLAGYNNRNVKGILEWARDGVPTVGAKKQAAQTEASRPGRAITT